MIVLNHLFTRNTLIILGFSILICNPCFSNDLEDSHLLEQNHVETSNLNSGNRALENVPIEEGEENEGLFGNFEWNAVFDSFVFLLENILGLDNALSITTANSGNGNIIGNGSFENGSFSANASVVDINNAMTSPNSGGLPLDSFAVDGDIYWIEDASRATDGNRFMYLPEAAIAGKCVYQSEVLFGGDFTTCATYEVTFDIAGFDENATEIETNYILEFFYWNAARDTEQEMVQDEFTLYDTTNPAPNPIPTSGWNNLNWTRVTGTITLPPPTSPDFSIIELVISVNDGGGALIDNICVNKIASNVSFSAEGTAATCSSNTGNDDGIIEITSANIGDKYEYNTTGFDDLPITYASVMGTITNTPQTVINNIPNSDTTTTYYLRVYESGDCFRDTSIVIAQNTCLNYPVSYSCSEATLLVGDLLPAGGGQTVAFPFDNGSTSPMMCGEKLDYGGEGISYCESTNKVYITKPGANNIIIWDIATNIAEDSINLTLGSPYDSALSPNCDYLYIATTGGLERFNLITNTIDQSRINADLIAAATGDGNPWGIDVHPITGEIYYSFGFGSDWDGGDLESSIHKVSEDLQGVIIEVVPHEIYGVFMGMKFLPNGDFWVTWNGIEPPTFPSPYVHSEEIRLYDDSGNLIESKPFVINGTQEYFTSPNDIAFGPDGNIYVSTYNEYCVIRYIDETNTWEVYLDADPSGATGKNLEFVCSKVICSTICDLDITTTYSSNCTESSLNNFTSDWNIGISTENSPDNNISYQRNSEVVQNHILTGTTDTLILSGVSSDGGSSDTLKVWFDNEMTCGDTIILRRPLPCPPTITTEAGLKILSGDICSSITNTDVMGTAFEDWNYDGIMNQSDTIGVQGVQVLLYDDNGLINTTYTDENGNYQFAGLVVAENYRVEFILPDAISSWASFTQVGANNGTSIQFVTSGDCANLGLSNPADFCQENPQIATTCYAVGVISDPTVVNDAALIEFAYNSGASGQNFTVTTTGGAIMNDEVTDIAISGAPDATYGLLNAEGTTAGQSKIVNATIGEIGATLGLAYHRRGNALLASSYMKRFTGLPAGPSDAALGSIYVIDRDNNPNAFVTFFTANAGTDNHDYSINHMNAPNGDTAAGASVGKAGWGDMDLSDDGTALYAINLFDKKIYLIPIIENNGTITAGTAQVIDFPSNITSGLCNANDWAPGGIKVYKGEVFISVTCTAETSQDVNDLKYLVYKFPVGSTAPFVQVVNMDNYARPNTLFNHNWNAWISTTSIIDGTPGATNEPNRYIYPQPWVTDIEFDDSGRIYLGIRNRTGDMRASFNDAGQPAYEYGDTPMGLPDGDGTFTMQANVQTGSGEPYEYIYDETVFPASSEHPENDMGTIGLVRGKGEIMVPASVGNLIQGMRTYSLSADLDATHEGAQPYRYYGLTQGNSATALGNPFGKIAGLGDVESLCVSAPIEIGNLVWNDTDEDGIQDPSESGVGSVTVELYDGLGLTMYGTTTTNSDGEYYFNASNVNLNGATGIEPYTNYIISIPNISGGTPQVALATLDLTISNVNTNDSDHIDSDAVAVGDNAEISVLTSKDGEVNHSYDFGLRSAPSSLGNFVWLDANNNGIQDATEVGVAGVNVVLYDSGANIIATTTTDAYGYYLFNELAAGDYTIAYTLPTNYGYTLVSQGVDDTVDSDVNPITGTTATVTLVAGMDNIDVDLGIIYIQPSSGSIGDYVWMDTNGDGNQNVGEVGLSGVTVTLYDGSGNVIATVLSNSNGNYNFSNLPTGTYELGFTLPIGTEFTTQTINTGTGSDVNTTTGTTGTFVLNIGEELTDMDAGLVLQDAAEASLGNSIWYDSNNNGIQDQGEVGVEGVVVNLYSSANALVGTTSSDVFGSYIFTGITAGDYYLEIDATTLPVGYGFTVANSGTDDTIDGDIDGSNGANTTAIITLLSGENNMTWDAGIYNAAAGTGSIGNFVFHDVNMNGLQDVGEVGASGVSVSLYDDLGNILATTATDANGYFTFIDLSAGDYIVGFTNLPDNYIFSLQDNGGVEATDSDVNTAGFTNLITLVNNEDNSDIDAGIHIGLIASGTASLGGMVFYDLDNDGLEEQGELGSTGISVNLLDENGATVLATTTTDGQGNYIFTGLSGGNYIVVFDTNTLPSGYNLSPQNVGIDESIDSDANTTTGQTNVISLTEGEDNLIIDAGIHNSSTLGSIGNQVWFDTNANGLQEANEVGMSGIMVSLYNDIGNLISTTTTNLNGNYLFDGLANGNYTIGFSNLPTGFSFTSVDIGVDDGIDSDVNIEGITPAITISGSNDITNIDAGLIANMAMLGNTVWFDLDANGIQDVNEVGVAGVTVILYDNTSTAVASTITDVNGIYLFTNLLPNDYTIGFSTLPIGATFTTQNATADNVDSDVDPATGLSSSITLAPTNVDLDTDAGLMVAPFGSLGNFVWYDTSANGMQDIGENGVPGILIELFDSNGSLASVAISGAEGNYLFDDLLSDDYTVEFSNLPTNYVFTYQDNTGSTEPNDSDPDRVLGTTTSYTINDNGHIEDVDAGITLLNIAGHAWYDDNNDGIRAVGESLLENVKIDLYTNTNVFVISSFTDINGYYEIIGITDGNYYVQFDETTNSNGLSFVSGTIQEANSDADIEDETDSDMDPNNKQTPMFGLAIGETKLNIDGGFVTVPLPVELLNFKGSSTGCEVNLEWMTASEENNSHFIVEYSMDSEMFVEAGRVEGAGNSQEILYYEFTMDNVAEGLIYYRLKQVDFDGTYAYSNTISVMSNCGRIFMKGIAIHPNPAVDEVMVGFQNYENQELEYMIVNNLGHVVKKDKVFIDSEQFSKTINVNYLPSGVYHFLIIKKNGDQKVFNIVISRL